MSYLRPLETDTLPLLNDTARARHLRALEEELAAYRRPNSTPSPGILKYGDFDLNSGSQTRRAVAELQDQLRLFREELRKKDSMIQHLVSLESAPRVQRSSDGVRFDTLYHGDRTALENARSELASLQVRFEKVSQQLKDADVHLEAKDIKIKELQNLLETNRENEARLADHVQTLRDRIRELEDQLGSFHTVSNRGEYTITTLQRDLRESNDKIVELEGRLRKQLEERESTQSKSEQAERRLADLLSHLSSLLLTDDIRDTSSSSIDILVRKMNDLVQENALMKGKIVTLTETLNNTQIESKASRETIMRLVSEMGREQKVTTKYTNEVENLRQERDNAVASRRDLEREIELLKERLESNQRALDATRAELELRNNRLSALDREVRNTSQNVHTTSTAFSLFREQLANLMRSVFENLDSSEEGIREAVRRLAGSHREQALRLEECDSRVKHLTEQLDHQLELHRDLAHRAKRYETEANDLESKLRSAEGELAAGDVLRDGLKTDKHKYLHGLQKLAEVMKMDRISLDLGLDMTLDALVSRAEQLAKLEGDAVADRTTHVYNLQRKVKSLKEQLESKDLHIDLLRKKLTGLEERLHGQRENIKDHESDSLRMRKLERLAEKYKLQLTDARQEIQNLKAQLLGTTELKLRTIEQRKEVEELAQQVQELEDIRRKQAHKISHLKEEVASTESHTQEKQVVAENAVQALSSELRTTKNALESIKYREKQLVDFRNVVSRMLGLDINTLAVPDYEIITRLEKLIKAHHTTALTTMGLEEALADVEDGFVSGLEATDPVIRRSRDRSRRKAAHARVRARSLSPTKRDPRVY